MYIAVISIHALVMAVLHFVKCIDNDWKSKSGSIFEDSVGADATQTCVSGCPSIWGQTSGGSAAPTPWTIILLVCLVFEALLFSIFTVIMFGVQIQAIWNDETGIEHLKKETVNSRRRSWKSFKSVFGKGFDLSWFSPFTRPVVGGEVETKFAYAV